MASAFSIGVQGNAALKRTPTSVSTSTERKAPAAIPCARGHAIRSPGLGSSKLSPSQANSNRHVKSHPGQVVATATKEYDSPPSQVPGPPSGDKDALYTPIRTTTPLTIAEPVARLQIGPVIIQLPKATSGLTFVAADDGSTPVKQVVIQYHLSDGLAKFGPSPDQLNEKKFTTDEAENPIFWGR